MPDSRLPASRLAALSSARRGSATPSLVRKKLRSLQRFDEVTKTRRLVGMLARKGYAPGLAHALVREELGAEAEEQTSL